MQDLKTKKGFTLVELSLSVAFIAILSITIVLIINDTISTYQRGLTLNQVNTVGMDLVDDMRAAVQNSSAKAAVELCDIYSDAGERTKCMEDEGRKFVSVIRISQSSDGVKVNGAVVAGLPLYGAFCTGAYSYIWSSGYLFMQENLWAARAHVLYTHDDTTTMVNDVKLMKVSDRSRAVCRSALGEGYYMSGTDTFDAGQIDDEPAVLLGDNSPLALYDLSAAAPAVSGIGAAFYSVSFILGTVKGGINVMSNGNFCETPESGAASENFDYCAINKFNFAARANGG